MAFPPPLWPSRLFDQNFGMCITQNDFLFPFYTCNNNYYRPWKASTETLAKDFGSTISNEKESFKVTLDVQHFKPHELSVKVANNQIIVEGRHEERKDEHGFVSRHFTRRYSLPVDCKPEDVISNLSSDGVLIILANKFKELPKNEKIVAITLCKSCPLKEATISDINIKQTEQSAELKVVESNKNNKQIMLKEDHCCLLLKPELLREAASESSEIIVEKKKDKAEEKLKVCQSGKNTSEMLEQTFAAASATSSLSEEMCGIIGVSTLEIVGQKVDKSKANIAASDEKLKGASAAISSSSEVLEQTFAKSDDKMSVSEEKIERFDIASAAKATSQEIIEQTFEQSSSATSEKAGHSRMTKSEMSELSMSSKTSECIESSSSYKASMTSNIKETSEELSDFVCDILCTELDKTLDIKK